MAFLYFFPDLFLVFAVLYIMFPHWCIYLCIPFLLTMATALVASFLACLYHDALLFHCCLNFYIPPPCILLSPRLTTGSDLGPALFSVLFNFPVMSLLFPLPSRLYYFVLYFSPLCFLALLFSAPEIVFYVFFLLSCFFT